MTRRRKAPPPELRPRDPLVEESLGEAGMMRLADARVALGVPLDMFRHMVREGWLPAQSVVHPKNGMRVPCVRRSDVEQLQARKRDARTEG